MNKERLLNVARALRESKNPELFTMRSFGHRCGTPACALGHYAAREDLQDAFTLNKDGDFCGASYDDPDDAYELGMDSRRVLGHFRITKHQAWELFSEEGCGFAATPIQAAEYIESFVARNEGAPKNEEAPTVYATAQESFDAAMNARAVRGRNEDRS